LQLWCLWGIHIGWTSKPMACQKDFDLKTSDTWRTCPRTKMTVSVTTTASNNKMQNEHFHFSMCQALSQFEWDDDQLGIWMCASKNQKRTWWSSVWLWACHSDEQGNGQKKTLQFFSCPSTTTTIGQKTPKAFEGQWAIVKLLVP